MIHALQLNYVNKSICLVQKNSKGFGISVEKEGFTLPLGSTSRQVTFKVPQKDTDYVLEVKKERLFPIAAIVRLNEEGKVVFPILMRTFKLCLGCAEDKLLGDTIEVDAALKSKKSSYHDWNAFAQNRRWIIC